MFYVGGCAVLVVALCCCQAQIGSCAGFLFFCLGLMFMFFDLVVVIWGFLFVCPMIFCSIFINDSIDLGFFVCLFAKKNYEFEG